MSPHAVNNFVTDLVEMAKAMEELPKAQQELAEAKQAIETDRQTIQRLESKLMDRANEIDTLNQRIHSLTEDKDNAEFRFLELEEKHGGLTKLIQAAASAVGMVDKPEPAVVTHEPFPHAEPVTAQSGVDSQGSASTTGEQSHGDMAKPEGQSASDPIATLPFGSESQSVTSHDAGTNNDAAQGTTDSPLPQHSATTEAQSPDASQPAPFTGSALDGGGNGGKYAGKRWSEVDQAEFWKGYNSSGIGGTKNYWIANGGDLESFYR